MGLVYLQHRGQLSGISVRWTSCAYVASYASLQRAGQCSVPSCAAIWNARGPAAGRSWRRHRAQGAAGRDSFRRMPRRRKPLRTGAWGAIPRRRQGRCVPIRHRTHRRQTRPSGAGRAVWRGGPQRAPVRSIGAQTTRRRPRGRIAAHQVQVCEAPARAPRRPCSLGHDRAASRAAAAPREARVGRVGRHRGASVLHHQSRAARWLRYTVNVWPLLLLVVLLRGQVDGGRQRCAPPPGPTTLDHTEPGGSQGANAVASTYRLSLVAGAASGREMMIRNSGTSTREREYRYDDIKYTDTRVLVPGTSYITCAALEIGGRTSIAIYYVRKVQPTLNFTCAAAVRFARFLRQRSSGS